MAAVGLSVVICTYNRAALLDELLASIEQELTPRLDLEVIVVDNNCTDNTAEIVESYIGRIPNLSRIVADKQGLSHARNAGARQSTKDFLIYIDDDAILSPAFLERCEIVIRRFDPDFFGGPVLPRFGQEVPDWFDPSLEIRQFERFSGFSENGSVSGGNFGVKKSVLEALGPFDTSLGMSGGTMGFGEDREMIERYRARVPKAKQKIYYAVEMPILHFTMPYKLTKSYQLQRKYKNAYAQERTFVKNGIRSRFKSLVFSCAHVSLFPLVAARVILRRGWTPTARYVIARHACGVVGRVRGTLSLFHPVFGMEFGSRP